MPTTTKEKVKSGGSGGTTPVSDPLPQDSIVAPPVQLTGGDSGKTTVKSDATPPTSGSVSLTPAADFKKTYTKDDAATKLHNARTDGSPNTTVASWIGYIVKKIKPPAGPVTGTYVSSFDTARGGFSASRTLPDVPDLVVHAHYQRDLSNPKTAKVNSAQVKWAHDEAGSAPPGETKLPKGQETQILGSDHDTLALAAWESNPKRHEMRQDAVGKKKAKEKENPLDLDWLFPG